MKKLGWQLWFQDNFDRESPRQMVQHGEVLVEGLLELWRHHLYETVQTDGALGFARYNLWLPEKSVSIVITGEVNGLNKLRQWIWKGENVFEAEKRGLLLKIAQAHAVQEHLAQGSRLIVRLAKQAPHQLAFEEKLKRV